MEWILRTISSTCCTDEQLTIEFSLSYSASRLRIKRCRVGSIIILEWVLESDENLRTSQQAGTYEKKNIQE